MVRIAFDLGWPALVAAYQEWSGDASERIRGGEIDSFSRSLFLGLMDVGNDFFRRLDDAAAQARERQRCAHQFQKRSSFERVVPFLGLLRKFTADEFFEHRRVNHLFQVAPVLSGSTRALAAKYLVAQQLEI